jgi:hypothetical protein
MDAVFGGAVVTVSGSYPTSQRNVNTGSASGSLWWNTDDGNLYIQAAGPSGSTWVPAVSSVADGTFGATYTDVEAVAATTWSIDHGLNTLTPIVQVYTGSQAMVPASIRSVNVNRTEITFATATAGTAILSTGVGGPTSASFAATSNLAVSASVAQTASYAHTASNWDTPTVAIQGNPNQAINNSSTTYGTSTRISMTAMSTAFNDGFTVSSTGVTPTVSGIYEIRIDAFGLDAGGNNTTLTSFIGVNNAGVAQRLISCISSIYTSVANSCVSSVAAGQLIDFRFGSTGGELITIQGASVFVRKIA